MIPLSSAISGGLLWSKTPRNRGFELNLNGEVVGKLQRSSCWSQTFLAETQDGRFTFRRSGFFRTGAEIVDTNSEEPIATLKSPWGGKGSITFADGQTFQLVCKGWWRPIWTVTTGDGMPVVRLHRREKTVELPLGGMVPDGRLSQIIMFTWYWVLQTEQDAASVAAVSVVSP